MRSLKKLFDQNRQWAAKMEAADPGFFRRLSEQQTPQYLWIGCSDSRVPANQIVGLRPGELFVHRNIANLMIHTDMNCLSVIQFAVDILKVKHIIVCGHYGCGGIRAAMDNQEHGLIDNWLRHIKDIYHLYREKITTAENEDDRVDLLCELNVIEQVANVCHTSIVQGAWKSGQSLAVHGWIYNIGDGILKDMNVCTTSVEEISQIHRIQ